MTPPHRLLGLPPEGHPRRLLGLPPEGHPRRLLGLPPKGHPRANKKQQEAIAAREGAFLVISGAGTGKTHVLTERMLSLINNDSVSPASILALTFTEKAAEEMTGRVEAALPLGHEGPCIRTFHGFCDEVLRERGHEIGLPLDYRLLTAPDLWHFLKKNSQKFSLYYYRPLGNPHKFLWALQEYFSRLRDEDITPEAYEKHAEKLFQKADEPEEKEYALRQKELAAAYQKYGELLAESGVMDFGGLLYWTNRLFEKRTSILKEYQERFQYLLVDEFQDTNFSQNTLVVKLAARSGNIMVVGDDDQSIYKWRGASLTNIAQFRKAFPQSRSIVLSENYRSTQSILDLAYAVIQKNNPDRLEVQENIEKKLVSWRAKKGETPRIHHFAESRDEVAFVLHEASRQLSLEKNTAILVRTNSLVFLFLDAMEKERIPFQHSAPSLLFSKAGVKDCMAVLRVIGNPQDDMAVFRALSLPCFEISMEKLLQIFQEARKRNIPVFEEMQSSEAFFRARELFSHSIEFSRNHTVLQTLAEFLQQSNLMKDLQEREAISVVEDIALFTERIKDFERNHAEKGVNDFLEFARLLEEVGESRTAPESLDPHAVKLLTIHASKGLEFDSVFLPALVHGKFPVHARREPFEIPEALIHETLPGENHHWSEERRLFYVAVTRAKESLTLSHSDFYDGKKQWKPSLFLTEALESGKAEVGTSLRKHRSVTKKAGQKVENAAPRIKRLNLDLPKLSYSQIDTFQTCPLKYQFRYLTKIPAPLPAHVHFGSSIHQTLKEFYEIIQEQPEKFHNDCLPLLLELYEKNWIPMGYESRALQDEQKKAGRLMLEKFYEHEKRQGVIPEFLEKFFSLELDGFTINGRIDRIDRLPDGTYEVIDYKTGSAPSSPNLKNNLQLTIYALACRDSLRLPVSRLSLYFLDECVKFSTTRDEKDLEKAGRELRECAGELAASDFAAVPGFHCSFCDYKSICPKAAVTA